MKVLHKNYTLATNGKILNISLIGMLRALGLGGATTSGAIPADILDCLRIGWVSPDKSGEVTLKTSPLRPCYYEVINRSILRVYLTKLSGGVHKLSVYAQYGTMKSASLEVALNVAQNVPYLTYEGHVIPLERDEARDEQGKLCYIYEYGDVTAWVDVLNFADTFTAYIGEGVDGVLEDAREVTGCSVEYNTCTRSYDMPSSIDFPAVESFGDGGGGGGGEVDYKTDIYMDGYGRVILERLDDGATLLLDEHENPIIKRMQNGETEYYDAYQNVRYRVGAHGESTINDVLKLLGDVYVRGVGGFNGGSTANARTLQAVLNGKIERVELECTDDATIHVKGTTKALTYAEVKALVDDATKFVTLRYLDMWWMLPSYDDGGAIMFASTQIIGGHIQVTRVVMDTDGRLNNYSIIGEDVGHKTSDLSEVYALDGHETYVATKLINEMVGILSESETLTKVKLTNGQFLASTNIGPRISEIEEVYSIKRSGQSFSGGTNILRAYSHSWDVSAVTSMSYIFSGCSSLSSLDVSSWDVSAVTSMHGTFQGCNSLSSLNVSSWDVSAVTDMVNMFHSCNSLSSLDVSSWDVSAVTSTGSMFNSCNSLSSLDVSSWDVSAVTSMGNMFQGCNSLSSLDVSSWDVSAVTNMDYMFYGCASLSSLDVSSWDVSAVTSMNYMFRGCNSLSSLDVSSWDVSAVTSMNYMFRGCNSLSSLDVSSWDVSAVTSMGNMFQGCNSLSSLDVSSWDVSAVTSMSFMFHSCNSLSSLDVSSWDVSAVTNMDYMFYGCASLSSLIGGRTSLDLSALTGLRVSLSLDSTKLDRPSLRAVINGLADLTGGTSQTLTLGATLRAKLTAEDIAIATGKNWVIA